MADESFQQTVNSLFVGRQRSEIDAVYRMAYARLMRRMGPTAQEAVQRLERTDPVVRAILSAATLEIALAMDQRPSDGPPMVPIVNQPWCPFEDEHLPHVQCAECVR